MLDAALGSDSSHSDEEPDPDDSHDPRRGFDPSNLPRRGDGSGRGSPCRRDRPDRGDGSPGQGDGSALGGAIPPIENVFVQEDAHDRSKAPKSATEGHPSADYATAKDETMPSSAPLKSKPQQQRGKKISVNAEISTMQPRMAFK